MGAHRMLVLQYLLLLLRQATHAADCSNAVCPCNSYRASSLVFCCTGGERKVHTLVPANGSVQMGLVPAGVQGLDIMSVSDGFTSFSLLDAQYGTPIVEDTVGIVNTTKRTGMWEDVAIVYSGVDNTLPVHVNVYMVGALPRALEVWFANHGLQAATVAVDYKYQKLEPCPALPAGCLEYNPFQAHNFGISWSLKVSSAFANASQAWATLAEPSLGNDSLGLRWYRWPEVWARSEALVSSSPVRQLSGDQSAFMLFHALDKDHSDEVSFKEFEIGFHFAANEFSRGPEEDAEFLAQRVPRIPWAWVAGGSSAFVAICVLSFCFCTKRSTKHRGVVAPKEESQPLKSQHLDSDPLQQGIEVEAMPAPEEQCESGWEVGGVLRPIGQTGLSPPWLSLQGIGFPSLGSLLRAESFKYMAVPKDDNSQATPQSNSFQLDGSFHFPFQIDGACSVAQVPGSPLSSSRMTFPSLLQAGSHSSVLAPGSPLTNCSSYAMTSVGHTPHVDPFLLSPAPLLSPGRESTIVERMQAPSEWWPASRSWPSSPHSDMHSAALQEMQRAALMQNVLFVSPRPVSVQAEPFVPAEALRGEGPGW